MTATRKRSGGGFLLGIFVGLADRPGDLARRRVLPQPHAGALHHAPRPRQAEKARGAGAGRSPALPQRRRPPTTGTPRSRSSTSTKILPGARGDRVDGRSCASACALPEPAARSAGSASKDVYFIQAGSFQNPADADNQKARLAILGFESSVEPANLPDKGTWYRVRLGPYKKVEEINKRTPGAGAERHRRQPGQSEGSSKRP